MNILIMGGAYPPVVTSSARLYSELSESLSNMGHNVTVITTHPSAEDMVVEGHGGYCTTPSWELVNGVNVLRVSHLSFLSKIPGGKPFRFFLSFLLFTIRGLLVRGPHVILVYSPPLFMGIAGYIVSKFKKARFVLNIQDIHPKVLFDMGVIKNSLLKKILSKMEDICYKKAHAIIVYSSGNRDYLRLRGVDRKVFIIPNWFDIPRVDSPNRIYSFRKEEFIGDKFVVSYAGAMGEAQGLEIVVEVAETLKKYNDIIFILAGEGRLKFLLAGLINERKLSNVLLLPLMAKDRYIQFLQASDVCLVTLSPDVPLQTVPGKLADIMACGRPIIAAVNRHGDAAGIINQAECGFYVDPGNVEAFAQAVLRLHRDESLRKDMGGKGMTFAARNFSRTGCTKQYEKVLFSATRGAPFYSK